MTWLTKRLICDTIYYVQEIANSVVLDRGSIPLTSIMGVPWFRQGEKVVIVDGTNKQMLITSYLSPALANW